MRTKQIKEGYCPICNCEIFEKDSNGNLILKPNKLYAEKWVLYDDGSNAAFPLCKNCALTATLEDMKKVNQMQKFTWGMEIIGYPLSLIDLYKQLYWYVSCASLLEVVKIGNTKEELAK